MHTAKAMRRTAKMDHCTTPKTRTNTHMFWACFLTTEIIILMVKLQLQPNLSTIWAEDNW